MTIENRSDQNRPKLKRPNQNRPNSEVDPHLNSGGVNPNYEDPNYVDPDRVDSGRVDSDYVDPDSNPDPMTGETGARPVGTGIGAAGAGTIGTAAGAILGGPIGGVIGAAVGSIAGGLLGKGVSETLDPTIEDEYWRHNYGSRPYVNADHSYEDYRPAYQAGYEGYQTYASQGMSFDAAEPQLRERYEQQNGNSRLDWDKARLPAQDAWHRLEQSAAKDRAASN